MEFKNESIERMWPEIKMELKKTWSQLSNDELEHTKGDREEISRLLQKKYGQAQEINETKLDKIFERFDAMDRDFDKKNDESVINL